MLGGDCGRKGVWNNASGLGGQQFLARFRASLHTTFFFSTSHYTRVGRICSDPINVRHCEPVQPTIKWGVTRPSSAGR